MRPLTVILFLLGFLFGQSVEWMTYYERSGFKETPRYEQTIEFCKRLDLASSWIKYTSFGTSPQGRELPLLIVDKNGHFTVEDVRKSGNIVFFIQAGIHSGEIDGKDAGLMLVREMAITRTLVSLLDNVTVLFNPIFNVDGHERFSAYSRANQNGPEEMGWRVTAQNLNLNRDYLKADAPEMQSWLNLYNQWLPDFFADCHVTDGADYQYVITYKIEKQGILDSTVINWLDEAYLPDLHQKMEESEFPLSEYVSFRKKHDPQSGMSTWATPPRYSDGYTAIHNRPGLLIETHMFKDYKNRVTATYEILKHTLSILNREADQLKTTLQHVDSLTTTASFRKQPFPLTYSDGSNSTMFDFLGYEYEAVKSDLSGGDWYRYSDKPKTYRVPFFDKMKPDISVMLPAAYIIPVEWQEVITRIRLHGIDICELTKPVTLKVSTYKFKNVSWQQRPYEGRHPLKFEMEPIALIREFPAGSVVIDMNQRTAKVIANILEPEARDSFVYWGFFDTIFERKEYVESYVMEERARMMLASDPELESEFEHKVQSDSSFANNSQAILMWFYQKSPYWDQFKDVYPVGRIFDRKQVNELLKK